MHRDDEQPLVDPAGLSRRTLLTRAAQGTLALTGASLLGPWDSTAIGSTASSHAVRAGTLPTTSGGGTPVRGGTLTLGATTGGASETLNPILALTNGDVIRSFQLFDTLFLPSADLSDVVPRLATSAEPNKNATVWTVHLREGVTWHDGSTLTADDVIYSLNFWTNPSGGFAGLANLIDLKRVRKLDKLTVRVPLILPDALWPTTTTTFGNAIVKHGTTAAQLAAHPIGTGPFKYVSFQRGRQSVFDANRHYWEAGKPYIDRLIVNSSFADDQARLNALLAGEIDLMPLADYLLAREQVSAKQVTVFGSPAPQPYCFIMRVDKGPFADVRVRQAIRLIADREALIEGALAGFATPANDLFGQGTRYFDNSAKRSQDIEQAKSLLKSAGHQGATFTLETAPVTVGIVEAATLLAQQATAAGIKLNVKQYTASTYYTPAGGLYDTNLREDYYITLASLDAYYDLYLSTRSTLNETFWTKQHGGQAAQKLLDQARAATKPALAEELWKEVQTQQFQSGGFLQWANADYVDLAAPKVRGASEGPCGYLNNGRLLDAWIKH